MRPSVALLAFMPAVLAVMSGVASAQSIPPIERNAGACTDCAVDGWTVVTTSPDVIVGNGPWPGGTYTMSDIAGGPRDGSTMQLLLSGTSLSIFEAVGTTITGLVAGASYTLSIWYQGASLDSASLGISYRYGDVEIVIGGTTHAFTTSAGDAWTEASITFTATSSTESIVVRTGAGGTGTHGGAVVIDAATVRGASPNGTGCTAGTECASGHCIDGVCCDDACTGQCEACDVVGSEGTCAPVAGAPHGARAACVTDGSVCGGACDGTTRDACAYPDASTLCRPGSCADGVAIVAASCNGAGACPPETTQACAPYACAATECAGGCTTDGECDASAFCSAGMCVAPLENGAPCDRARQCASGRCVDGVCCDAACTGQCEACDVAGSEGTCVAVTGAPHGARAACATDGSACGGSCDGTVRAACAYPGASVSCGEATCAGSVARAAGACDGAGACEAGASTDCAPYACGEGACVDACGGPEDCAIGYSCRDGECVATELDGGATIDGGATPPPPPASRGGCGCSAPRGAGAPAGVLALLVLALVRRSRRRRRR